MTEETKDSLLERCADLPPRDRRNQLRFVWACLAWAISFVGISQLLKRGMISEGPLQWALAMLPFAAGIGVLVIFARFLRETDELQRLIQLQALAIAFGGSYFAMSGYTVLERIGAPALGLDDVTVFMAVLYVLGIVVGRRRYR